MSSVLRVGVKTLLNTTILPVHDRNEHKSISSFMRLLGLNFDGQLWKKRRF